MKVILAAKSVYPFHPFGGVQKYVYYFAKHLLDQGIEVEIVAPLDAGQPRTEIYEGITYTLLAPAIYSYLELPIGWWGVHMFSRQCAKYLQGKSFDILHAFDLTGLEYLKVPGHKPVIAHIFTDNYLCNPIPVSRYLTLFGHNSDLIKNDKVALSPFADLATKLNYPAQYIFKVNPMSQYLHMADGILLEDEIFRQQVVDVFHLNADKTSVLPVGVDVQYVETRKKAAPLTKTQLGFKQDDRVILTVNRLAADKGIDKIILALKIIRKTILQAKLIIVGSGYAQSDLLALIKTNDLSEHVRLVQDVREEDLYGYYKIADMYVCAFSYPGSSVSTLEAMAAGLPIITTAQPWLIKDQSNGAYIPDNDPQTIAQAVVGLKNSNLALMGESSKNIATCYDWPVITRQAKAFYERHLSVTFV